MSTVIMLFPPHNQLLRQVCDYSKTCLKHHLKRRPKIGFQDRVWVNTRQVLRSGPGELSAILSTCIKLLSAFKTYKWPLMTV